MKYYPTPPEIVSIIEQHIPENITSILEPAVGNGALISPISAEQDKLTLIDIDVDRINEVISLFPNAKIIHTDYIEWAKNSKSKFDLIITNPPFSGKVDEWIDFNNKKIPLEIAFIELCFEQLENDGTLIAIVPCSVISSQRWNFLRTRLLKSGSFLSIYQLPKKVFMTVEGAFYLFVYKKSSLEKNIKIINYENSDFFIFKQSKVPNNRLDYNYLAAHSQLSSTLSLFEKMEQNVFQLNDYIHFKRGMINKDYKNKKYIHSTHLANESRLLQSTSIDPTKDQYILVVKRVSRDAHLSFSLLSENLFDKCTDCIIAGYLDEICPFELLFSMRILYSNNIGKHFLLKGSGAKYISIRELRVSKAINLSKVFTDQFSQFKKHLLNKEYASCSEIEKRVGCEIHNMMNQQTRLSKAM